MLHARRQIRKVVAAYLVSLLPIVQNAVALQNEIDFFFAIVERTLATAACIDCDLSETGNASQNSILRIAFPEDGFVAATSGFGSSNVLT